MKPDSESGTCFSACQLNFLSVWGKMHPAWLIEDIRYLIFERLEQQDIARLAQTCRIFFDLATNELWRTVHSTIPFLACLPPDYNHRPLHLEDIRRLDLYASKVENLVLKSPKRNQVIYLPPPFRIKLREARDEAKYPDLPRTHKLWEDLWREIENLRPVSQFLPNLCRIELDGVVEELFTPFIGISGLNLTRIYIRYIHHRQSPSIVQHFLDRFQDTPKLRYLFIRGSEPDIIPSKLIEQAPLDHLQFRPRIRRHRHDKFRYKTFRLRTEILQKSSLENLTLVLTRDWYTYSINALQRKYLPALRTLWLDLTTFKPKSCEQTCINIGAQSWTCKRKELEWCPAREKTLVHVSAEPVDCGRRPPHPLFRRIG